MVFSLLFVLLRENRKINAVCSTSFHNGYNPTCKVWRRLRTGESNILDFKFHCNRILFYFEILLVLALLYRICSSILSFPSVRNFLSFLFFSFQKTILLFKYPLLIKYQWRLNGYLNLLLSFHYKLNICIPDLSLLLSLHF